ncbi:MAG TPA: dienelactone hydrolase family protein [Trinickia sp.]|uniref:dienelactone hydrolase family protein n=1 Tax=Trinickia sp. TaxID=2571163 RepID=UPI002B888BB3|nr:dienelactone hydrolase family protein [Trinickia sp.]HTI17144.1 dienelactone hydrolase family protein [Trinickia sp.]
MQTAKVMIPSDRRMLEGMLVIPDGARGIVAFAHGSGSSRLSPRNRDVADTLHQLGLATLLFDLLTDEESRRDLLSAEYRFDIPLLAQRLSCALDWLRREPSTALLPMGLFGASTGAAAALSVAAGDKSVRALVSRGGRPDLAQDALTDVAAPTLFIVGELDREVLRLNEAAADRLACEHRIEIVPGATHLFEESGALEQVAHLAAQWFLHWLAEAASGPVPD